MVSVLLLLGVTSVASAVNTACTFQSNTDYSHGGDRVQTPAVSIVELQLRLPLILSPPLPSLKENHCMVIKYVWCGVLFVVIYVVFKGCACVRVLACACVCVRACASVCELLYLFFFLPFLLRAAFLLFCSLQHAVDLPSIADTHRFTPRPSSLRHTASHCNAMHCTTHYTTLHGSLLLKIAAIKRQQKDMPAAFSQAASAG